jgi:1-acyl-sn-glycerol-3-phosphate acyltransferase
MRTTQAGKTNQKRTSTESITAQVSPRLLKLIYPLARFLVLPIYFRGLEVTGQENIPREGPVILAPTHRSRWDAIVVGYTTGISVSGRHPYYMTSADEFQGIKKWLIPKLGGFPVDRDRPGISSFRHGIELLQQKQAIVIFPQGGIVRDREIGRLKPGLGRLAMQGRAMQPDLDIKIVPIALKYDPFIPKWRCDATVCIGKPLNVANYPSDKPKESATQLTADLKEALQAIDPE